MRKEVGPVMPPAPLVAGGALQAAVDAAEALALAVGDDDTHVAMDLSADGDAAELAPDDDAAATHVLGSVTDDMIANLFRRNPGLTVSVMQDIFRIARSGPPTASGPKQLFKRIDALPGMNSKFRCEYC